jgi:hypothetical protein
MFVTISLLMTAACLLPAAGKLLAARGCVRSPMPRS